MGPRAPNRSLPGDTEGDGGLQKSSNSELRSQTLPSQLPGDAEALSRASVSCNSGDKRPLGSAFAPPAFEVLSAERRQDRGSGWAWLGPMVLKWHPQTLAPSVLVSPQTWPGTFPDPRARAERPWHLGDKPGRNQTVGNKTGSKGGVGPLFPVSREWRGRAQSLRSREQPRPARARPAPAPPGASTFSRRRE